MAPLLLVVLSGLATGCGEPPLPPATVEDALEACHAYNEAACGAFAACLGSTDNELADCITRENASCRTEIGAETCFSPARDGFLRCASAVEDKSCESLCSDFGCRDLCFFSCPALQQPAGQQETVVTVDSSLR